MILTQCLSKDSSVTVRWAKGSKQRALVSKDTEASKYLECSGTCE